MSSSCLLSPCLVLEPSSAELTWTCCTTPKVCPSVAGRASCTPQLCGTSGSPLPNLEAVVSKLLMTSCLVSLKNFLSTGQKGRRYVAAKSKWCLLLVADIASTSLLMLAIANWKPGPLHLITASRNPTFVNLLGSWNGTYYDTSFIEM
eukprot:7678439-Ditylum_brightwellii.AAC.1